MPIEAGEALRQTLGILDDQEAAVDPIRAASLDERIQATWSEEEWRTLSADDRPLELEIEDAALILHGLALTELLSIHLPWFDMVQWTVDFVTGELRGAWTDDEWAAA